MAKRRATKTKRAKRVHKTARAKATAKRPTRAATKQRTAKKAVGKRWRGRRATVPKGPKTPAALPSTSDVPWLDPPDPPESGTPT